MKLLVKSASFSTDNGQKSRFFCSYRISNNKNFIPKYLDNALKVLLKLHEHRGDRIGERKLLWTILWGSRAGNHCWSKIGNWRGKSFCCYDNSDVIATLMMTNFHLNTTVVAIFPNVCLWRRSLYTYYRYHILDEIVHHKFSSKKYCKWPNKPPFANKCSLSNKYPLCTVNILLDAPL